LQLLLQVGSKETINARVVPVSSYEIKYIPSAYEIRLVANNQGSTHPWVVSLKNQVDFSNDEPTLRSCETSFIVTKSDGQKWTENVIKIKQIEEDSFNSFFPNLWSRFIRVSYVTV